MRSNITIQAIFFDLGNTLIANREWIEGALELLIQLPSYGIRPGLISNTDHMDRDMIGPYLPNGFRFDLFEDDLVLLSGEIGIPKPDPRIFKLAIARAGGSADTCMFVSEELEHCLVAQALGMKIVRIGPDSLQDLADLLPALIKTGIVIRPGDNVTLNTTRSDQRHVLIEHEEPMDLAGLMHVAADHAFLPVEGPAMVSPTARAIAETYIGEHRHVFGLDVQTELTSEDNTLVFVREKKLCGTVVVVYEQHYRGIPVYEATLAIHMNKGPLRVTSSASSLTPDLRVDLTNPGRLLSFEAILAALGLQPGPERVINRQRELIFHYRADNRIEDDEDEAHPEFFLPDVSPEVEDNSFRHGYEVFFSKTVGRWGEVHWKAMIDAETHSVLFLRSNVAGATGSVFKSDPSTRGYQLTPLSPDDALDEIREIVELPGLISPDASGMQRLTGEYVTIVDKEPVTAPPPEEAHPFDFTYPVRSNAFAAVNAYYHCDGCYRMMEDMGFDIEAYFNGTSFPVQVDHRGEEGFHYARARANTSQSGMDLYTFGAMVAGQDLGLACNPRMVMHEFGHALLWDHVGSANFGFAHSPGDALAAILFDPENKHPDRFASFPFDPELNRRHDRYVSDGWGWFGPNYDRNYRGEQILSTTLFRMYRALGGDAASLIEKKFAATYSAFLIIEGVGLLAAATEDPNVYVQAMRTAERNRIDFEGHPGCTAGKVITWAFEKQNLNEGKPPKLDIYIKDAQNGEYDFQEEYWRSTGIWNRRSVDGDRTHQNPIPGQPNFLYVLVGNRGLKKAPHLNVRTFHITSDQSGSWPGAWRATTTHELTHSGSLRPGGEVVVGPFEWIPEAGSNDILAIADTPEDRDITTKFSTHIQQQRLVRWDNNIAQRRMTS